MELMSLPEILPGLLRDPMRGRELTRLFRSTISHFRTTDLSQV